MHLKPPALQVVQCSIMRCRWDMITFWLVVTSSQWGASLFLIAMQLLLTVKNSITERMQAEGSCGEWQAKRHINDHHNSKGWPILSSQKSFNQPTILCLCDNLFLSTFSMFFWQNWNIRCPNSLYVPVMMIALTSICFFASVCLVWELALTPTAIRSDLLCCCSTCLMRHFYDPLLVV